jgi:hypothetical protein
LWLLSGVSIFRVGKHNPKQHPNLSDKEYHHFAEQFTDMILDRRKPWVFQHFLYGGFQNVPTREELNSGQLALQVLHARNEGGVLWETWVTDALIREDRQRLVPYFKKHAQRKRLTKDELARLLEVGKSSVLRKSFKELARPFSSHRGPKPKLPTGKYAEALETAELLKPAILKFLEIPKTSHTCPRLCSTCKKTTQQHANSCYAMSA